MVALEARQAFGERRFDQSEVAMKRLAKLREPTPDDHMLRGQLALVRNDNDAALSELASVPDSHEIAPQARLQQGQIELRRDRARAAERFFLEAIRLKPTLAQARKELIFVYGFQLRRADLYEQFRALSEIEPLRFDQVLLWGQLRGVVWNSFESDQQLSRFLAADPTDRASRLGLVDTYRRTNRFEEANDRLAPLSNDDPAARALRVQIALDLGDLDSAETLLAGGPRQHNGLALLRGRMALARGEDNAAAAHFRDALAADPDHRESLLGLALVLRRLGAPDAPVFLDALAQIEKLSAVMQRAAVPGAGKNPELLRDLGSACAEVGRLPEARAWYALAIELDPLDTRAQQALYRLKDASVPVWRQAAALNH
jgi:tetratricopeptide (TPR) repeat protein